MKWLPATTSDKVYCVSCANEVDTPEEIATYPDGNCPDCGNPWTGAERKDTSITVASPTPMGGATLGS
jgi:predicted RNA-binding Zn-ribbon protein involved in translation (DUF1610 family)